MFGKNKNKNINSVGDCIQVANEFKHMQDTIKNLQLDISKLRQENNMLVSQCNNLQSKIDKVKGML